LTEPEFNHLKLNRYDEMWPMKSDVSVAGIWDTYGNYEISDPVTKEVTKRLLRQSLETRFKRQREPGLIHDTLPPGRIANALAGSRTRGAGILPAWPHENMRLKIKFEVEEKTCAGPALPRCALLDKRNHNVR